MSDDKRLERIENKTDHIIERVSSIDSTLSAQHVSLVEHMRRTELLESKLEPIEKHVSMVNGAMKLIGAISILAAIYKALR